MSISKILIILLAFINIILISVLTLIKYPKIAFVLSIAEVILVSTAGIIQ